VKNAILIFTGFAVLAFGINFAANWVEMQPSPIDRKFVVVDTYRGCDVVQYVPTNAARYFYFLHCKK
jgi:hypothetical protein